MTKTNKKKMKIGYKGQLFEFDQISLEPAEKRLKSEKTIGPRSKSPAPACDTGIELRVEQAEELDMLIEALIIARREIALLYSFN